jgi:hypothetical protein
VVVAALAASAVFDYAAPVLGDLGINEGLAQGFQRRECSFFVDAH